MLLFSVLTLDVTPGSGVSLVFTDPLCGPRPETGNCTACPNTKLQPKRTVPQTLVCALPSSLIIPSLPQLLPKPADTQPHQHHRKDRQHQKIRPQLREPALLHQNPPRNQAEMTQRI